MASSSSRAALASLLGDYASEDDVNELSDDEEEVPSSPAATSTLSSINTPGKRAFISMFNDRCKEGYAVSATTCTLSPG